MGVGMSYISFDFNKDSYKGVILESKENYFIMSSSLERLYVYESNNSTISDALLNRVLNRPNDSLYDVFHPCSSYSVLNCPSYCTVRNGKCEDKNTNFQVNCFDLDYKLCSANLASCTWNLTFDKCTPRVGS